MKNPYPLEKDASGCPYLFLAPMEGVGDEPFRRAMASVGGFNEAVTEFIRVPCQGHVESLAQVYNSSELSPIPLAAQIMGSNPELVAAMGKQLEMRGAQRIDLNCGCPSNTVTGKGAGSSLLKNPSQLYTIGRALVEACQVPVTIKMRSGYEDTSLFLENLKAAEESGVAFITVHPRTKADGYVKPANWDLIAFAKANVSIPIVGNGDICDVSDALKMLKNTSCDALMIGRGAVKDPFIFLKIKHYFLNASFQPRFEDYELFIRNYVNFLRKQSPEKTKINKLKQILNFIFSSNKNLDFLRKTMLQSQAKSIDEFLENSLNLLKASYI